MEQWLDDQYDVQGMDSLSGQILKRTGTGICNIGVRARGGTVGAPNGPTNNLSRPRFARPPPPPTHIENLPTPEIQK